MKSHVSVTLKCNESQEGTIDAPSTDIITWKFVSIKPTVSPEPRPILKIQTKIMAALLEKLISLKIIQNCYVFLLFYSSKTCTRNCCWYNKDLCIPLQSKTWNMDIQIIIHWSLSIKSFKQSFDVAVTTIFSCVMTTRQNSSMSLNFAQPLSFFTWRHRGHVGVPNQSCGSWTLFLCKLFLLLHRYWPLEWKFPWFLEVHLLAILP